MLGHMVILVPTLKKLPHCAIPSIAAAPFYIPNNAQGFSFSTALPKLVISTYIYFYVCTYTRSYIAGNVENTKSRIED